MSKAAFIFHGTKADRDLHWFPWLEEKLEEEGYEVVRPAFPTPEGQRREVWLEIFDQYSDRLDENTILVGHSLGAGFILNVLEEYDQEVSACFLVSSWTGPLGLEGFDPLNESFVERDFDFEELRQKSGKFVLYHGEDDPYVPLEKAEELSGQLDAELKVFEGGGHLNQETGYTEFPQLLEDIENA